MDYPALRSMIVGARVTQAQPARVCAHMLSILSKREQRGEECPEYEELLREAHAREA